MAEGKVRAHVYISGIVQGVFFRYYTQRRAVSLGVKGWVRNRPDGRVEAVFEGDRPSVVEMIQWCRKGPPSAEVSEVEVTWEPYTGEFYDFEIRY